MPMPRPRWNLPIPRPTRRFIASVVARPVLPPINQLHLTPTPGGKTMSAIDRAFIRAYSKDVAAEPIVEEAAPATPASAPPYVLSQTPRRPETTSRIEPAAPWGQTA